MSSNSGAKEAKFTVRLILKAGSIVFGLSAMLLILLPAVFLDLLALDGTDSALVWSMRMIGITLVALSGNMWANYGHPDSGKVRQVAMVMCMSATALGLLTLLIPANLTWFSIVYALIGFGFGAAYLMALSSGRVD